MSKEPQTADPAADPAAGRRRRRRDLSLSSADLAAIGYNCTCNTGYVGDAFSPTATNALLASLLLPDADGNIPRNDPGCRELDPCLDGLHNCDPNADCTTDALGAAYAFTCTCKNTDTEKFIDVSPRDNNGDIITTGLICEDVGKNTIMFTI